MSQSLRIPVGSVAAKLFGHLCIQLLTIDPSLVFKIQYKKSWYINSSTFTTVSVPEGDCVSGTYQQWLTKIQHFKLFSKTKFNEKIVIGNLKKITYANIF